jgi:hypothetical protein
MSETLVRHGRDLLHFAGVHTAFFLVQLVRKVASARIGHIVSCDRDVTYILLSPESFSCCRNICTSFTSAEIDVACIREMLGAFVQLFMSFPRTYLASAAGFGPISPN